MAFIHFSVVKKRKEKYYFMTCENYMELKCQCPQRRFCWHTTTPVPSPLSVAAFILQEQSGVLATEAIWPESLQYLLSDLLRKQGADPCSRIELPDSSHPEASWKMMTFAQQTETRGGCPTGLGLEEQWLSAPEVLIQRPLWPGASIPPAAV